MSETKIKFETVLPNSPQVIYDAWLDSKKHGEIINGKAKIDPKVGGKFSLWDDYIVGVTLELHPTTHTIIQSWRDNDSGWPDGHFSQITISFLPHGNGQTKLVFTQTGVPEKFVKSIEEGWQSYYWDNMKKYFSQ